MLPGVFQAKKKDGTIYYRASITYQTKHISLGSYPFETLANNAYLEANTIINDTSVSIDTIFFRHYTLPYDKSIILLNLRDNKIYFSNPIYLRKGYFSYYMEPSVELKFDIDDLFYYSSHRILKRQGHLYVNDYGMQYSILSRYGIKPFAVVNRDYTFANGDTLDYRYSNVIIINHFHGVFEFLQNGIKKYKVLIHLNGNYKVGIYDSEEIAAIAYNKAADLAKSYGATKNFIENYIDSCSPKQYADIYTNVKISKRYINYLESVFVTKRKPPEIPF